MKLTASQFARCADDALGDLLAERGFDPISAEQIGQGAWFRTYRNGKRYIRVSAGERSRDEEPHLDVLLGEGTDAWPETDWNTIALRTLAGHNSWYPLEESEAFHLEEASIRATLREVRDDLERHAADFLEGDLRRFLDARAAQNEQREAYRIHSPGADGTYTTKIDPKSAGLKERYSKGAG